MLYLVAQYPKRHGVYTSVVFVEAKSKAEAIRFAAEQHPQYITTAPSNDVSRATATPFLDAPEYNLLAGPAFNF